MCCSVDLSCLDAGFLEKNRDTLSADLLQVIQASSFKFVTSMFKEDYSAVRWWCCFHQTLSWYHTVQHLVQENRCRI